MSKARGLGRGLGALFPVASQPRETPEQLSPARGTAVDLIDVNAIAPNPRQPRRDFDESALRALAQSIAANGLLAPIVVRKSEQASNQYEIVVGERRWRAARMCGMERIPALVREARDGEAVELARLENVQRTDLNAIEEASGYKQLIDEHGYTQETLAQRLGKSRPGVANALRLLNLPDSVQAMIRDGRLSAGHGKALAILAPVRAETLAREAVRRNLSVREVERAASTAPMRGSTAKQRTAQTLPHELAEVESRLRFALATKVVLRPAETGGGSIEIIYANNDELQRIVDSLAPQER